MRKEKKIFYIICITIIALISIQIVIAALGLESYPYPFIKEGVLDDTVFVIGESASSSDSMGATILAVALQNEAVTKETIPLDNIIPATVTAGVAIKRIGNNINYDEEIEDSHPGEFNKNDLPKVLGDERFMNAKYEQRLDFGSNAFTFVYAKPDDMPADDYVFVREGAKIYDYYIDFPQPLNYDEDDILNDFKGRKIMIQGDEFTILQAKGKSKKVSELSLSRKDDLVLLVEEQPYTFGEHIITLVGVDGREGKCMIKVGEVTRTITEGKSDTVNNVPIRVLDAINRVRYGGLCEISLSDTNIVLTDGEYVSVNNKKLYGSKVEFTGNPGSLEGIKISYFGGMESKGINSDDLFLAKGSTWTDPVFGNWKIIFEGTTAYYESLSLKTSSRSATFKYTNVNNREVSIPFYYNEAEGEIKLGTASKPLLLPGENIQGKTEKIQLLFTKKDGDTRVLEITDTGCNRAIKDITIIDKTTDSIVAMNRKLEHGCDGNNTETISLGSLGYIRLIIDENGIEYVSSSEYGDNTPKTRYKGTLTFAHDSITIKEEAGKEIAPSTITLNIGWNSGRKQIEVLSVQRDGSSFKWVDSDTGNIRQAVTPKGTKVKYRSNSVDIMMPESDVYANLFLAPITGTLIPSQTQTVTKEKINPFGTSFIVLDKDAQYLDKNMIVIGGPCVNKIAAELLGNKENCAEGFLPERAMIRLFDRKGKTVLLAAGYSAEDTLAAADALSKYRMFPISGRYSEVIADSGVAISVKTK